MTKKNPGYPKHHREHHDNAMKGRRKGIPLTRPQAKWLKGEIEYQVDVMKPTWEDYALDSKNHGDLDFAEEWTMLAEGPSSEIIEEVHAVAAGHAKTINPSSKDAHYFKQLLEMDLNDMEDRGLPSRTVIAVANRFGKAGGH